MDFYGPLPTGDYLLVVIDRYSRFPEVKVVRSTKASSVIPKLDRIFAVHGISRIIKSDNGPLFNGEEYKRYADALEITLKFSTPLWPQGNAEAKRFMQPLAKALKTAKIAQRPWQQELQRFLLQYRQTPHCSTRVPPAKLLFNRTVRGQLPTLVKPTVANRHQEARKNEKRRQEYNERYTNSKSGVKKSEVKVGDSVLVRQGRKNKLTSHFNPTPYEVTSKLMSDST
jgi:transposase InsO family protein